MNVAQQNSKGKKGKVFKTVQMLTAREYEQLGVDVKLELIQDFQKGATEQAEKSRREIRARKKGAAGVRSNKRAAVTRTQTKSLSQMSDAELEKALANASFD